MRDLDRARALFGQGLERYAAGDFAKAEQHFRQASELAPDRLSIMGNLSAVLLRQDKVAEARDWAMKALARDADNFEALMNLGACLEKEQQPGDALALFEKASAVKPDAADAWSNCGHALHALKRYEDALIRYDRALALQPAHAEAWTNRGNALNELGRHEEALASHDRALAVQPRFAEAWYNRGNALAPLKRDEQALASYDEALRIQPGHADAHHNKSLVLLNRGEFGPGWREYEWRWQSTNFPSVRPGADITRLPEWDGQPVRGCLLAWAEQGVGDEILYGSMLRDLQASADRVAVTLDKRLIPLFKRSLPDIRFLPRDTPLPAGLGDAQIAMGSMGRHLRGHRADFARNRAFLQADATLVARLRSRLAVAGRRVLGISWGSKNARVGGFKSLQLQDLLPVLSLPGITLVDLQYGDTSDERRRLEDSSGISVRHMDDIDNFNDIDGLAALVEACDVVVTISNVTVHLAGALGKPAFLLAPWSRGRIWYWHDGEAQCLWYPSVRLYGQTPDGDWSVPIRRLAADLAA